jgi:hypothetical protein
LWRSPRAFTSIRRFPHITALLAIAGLLGILLVSAPAAPAATINACQKKKGGTIRIVGSKTKCKKTEKKIKWSTTGPAGKNGASGTNGSNGSNGAAGAPGATGPQGPGAVRFSGGVDTIAALSDTQAVAPFVVGGVTISFNCGNALFLNAASIKVNSPTAGTLFTTAIYKENPDNAIDGPQINFQNGTLSANSTETDTVALAGGDATNNPSTFTTVIDNGTQTIVVTGSVQLSTSCQIRGIAVPASS